VPRDTLVRTLGNARRAYASLFSALSRRSASLAQVRGWALLMGDGAREVQLLSSCAAPLSDEADGDEGELADGDEGDPMLNSTAGEGLLMSLQPISDCFDCESDWPTGGVDAAWVPSSAKR